MLRGLGDLLGHLEHVRQVGGAVFGGGGAHRDEYDLATADRIRQVRAEVQAMRPIALDELRQPRLEEGHLASAQLVELLLVYIHTGDVSARICEARSCDETHVARPNDCDFQDSSVNRASAP